MSKKSIAGIVTVCIIALASTIYAINNKEELPDNSFSKCFDYSGARVINSEIYIWGRLNSNFDSQDMLISLTQELKNSLGTKSGINLTTKQERNDYIQKVEISGTLSDGSMVNIIAKISKSSEQDNEKDKRFVSVSAVQDLENSSFEGIKDNVLNIFKKHDIVPRVNTCVTGNFEGKLETRRLNEISKEVFQKLNAKKVNGIVDDGMISVTAYSTKIEDCIIIDGEKVNLNLAIRYNSYENKTYMWIATPVITTEY